MRLRAALIRTMALLCVGAAASACLSGCGASRGAPFGHGRTDLLPDLETAPLRELYLQRVGREVLLRMSHEIDNVGRGPFEIHPVGSRCGAGLPGVTYGAQEWIFRDSDGNRSFDRARDAIDGKQVIGCLVYHRLHRHWHIANFVRYELFRYVDGRRTGSGPVRTSGKVSFCVVDTLPVNLRLPGSPRQPYFQVADALAGDCKEHTTLGLSVGYGDIYRANLADQFIRVTGLRSGRYCLVERTDPLHFVPELSYANNDRGTVVTLLHRRARFRSSRTC